jgi:hypothetical protein
MIRSLMIAAASAVVLKLSPTAFAQQPGQFSTADQARAMLAKAVGRVLAAAFLLVASTSARAAIWELPLGPYGVFRLDVPSGWTAGPRSGFSGRDIAITPPQGVPLILLITPTASKNIPDTLSEVDVRRVVTGLQNSAEEPVLEAMWFEGAKSRGFYVSATDKTVTQPTAENFKYITQGALVTGRIRVVFTILTNLSSAPERDRAREIVRSAWHEPAPIPVDAAGPAPPGGPFTFTVPESQVIVKVSDPSLRPDDAARTGQRYFKLARRDPLLILSGWLEPAYGYKGLKEFWQSESRSPAFAGALAPIRVEMLQTGPWEVVAYDVPLPVPGGAMANVRAERVQAGTWIDLHLSTASTRPSATLRAELLAALRQVEVVEK